jgi:hypothetical protein
MMVWVVGGSLNLSRAKLVEVLARFAMVVHLFADQLLPFFNYLSDKLSRGLKRVRGLKSNKLVSR